jgi:signal transduction histidine kinase/CheY-like chemotaxis protein
MVQSLRRNFFGACLVLTVAYAVTGKLAMLLAVPPGYASPVFPPAGIAVAAMFIGGWATLPFTFLGSFLLNLWVGYSVGSAPDLTRLAAASFIGAASVLQAAIGGTVLRRAVGYPAALDNGRDLTRLLLLLPMLCLTSATLSLAFLSFLDLVRIPDLLTNWVSWWIGDTLGALVVLPLMLVIAGEPRDLWRRRALPVAVPMLLFSALFITIFVRVNEWERDESLLEFRLLSHEIVDKIHTGLEEQSIFLAQLERSFSQPTTPSAADFHHLVERLLQRFPLIQAVEWAPRVDSAQRAAFEASRQSDLPGFEIREVDPSGYPRRAGHRAQYYPVTYIEPLRGNEEAAGLDIASDLDRKAALEAAMRTGALAATTPIRLVQETAEQAGILFMFPVLDGSADAGVLLVVHRMGAFLEGLLAPFNSMVRIQLVDRQAGKVLFGGFSPGPGDARYDDVFTFGGRSYGVTTAPTDLYMERHRSLQSWAVLVRGIVGTSLLGGLLLLGTGYAHRIETVVKERTHDLEEANRRLNLEMQEREHAQAALRQAQRMEAVGQLTGGIAHDFNNLLMVFSGNAALLREQARDDAVQRRASAIMRAVERGERLTRQLLAFSRRQVLRPEPVDLRHRMQEFSEMLSRSLRGDIELNIELAPNLWPVSVDPAELELALLNIGVNARDAMPNGGRFEVEARNVSFAQGSHNPSEGLVGDFVALRLLDTGTGMEAEVRSRAFEPFYTTKDVGLGSGLGLSQVYGFAKQSGGAASIASEIGKGTAITLYLPRASAGSVASGCTAAEDIAVVPPARVLLVEDDREVADVAAQLLREIGCSAVEARDAKSALALLARDPTIGLMLSDIVMPGGMNGIELARHVRGHRPDLPILLATGYSRYAPQLMTEGFALVAKPYHRDRLAASIRAAMGGTQRSARPIRAPSE